MKVATEVASEKHVFECIKYGVDMVWLGARTTANPFLVQEIADALSDTDGRMYNITNEDLNFWQRRFEALEGYDIYSAASVAVASLAEAVKTGAVRKDEIIMLNVTGGGEELAKSGGYYRPMPQLVLSPEVPEDEIIHQVDLLFGL